MDELLKASAGAVPEAEMNEARRLVNLGLPPVTSRMALATMFGISPGLIWSFESRTRKHYRTFFIPKGSGKRRIDAPRIALKIIQKWLSVHLQKCYQPPEHVYGFVSAKSHVAAAARHCGASWVFSVDLKDFFQSTPEVVVINSLERMGFAVNSATLLAKLSCLNGTLAQGSPSSPVLSNICFEHVDEQLLKISKMYNVRLSRYADDITFSGTGVFPAALPEEVLGVFEEGPWRLAEQKTDLAMLPNRLKVHGLLVHGNHVRLTKGYRNRLRAFRHLLKNHKVSDMDLARVQGHLEYSEFVERF
ncbi:MAG: RNA-directed DNA polymerase [Ferrovum sp.]|nr:RNA-directed DNA polymerase [Ferrovum sp.]